MTDDRKRYLVSFVAPQKDPFGIFCEPHATSLDQAVDLALAYWVHREPDVPFVQFLAAMRPGDMRFFVLEPGEAEWTTITVDYFSLSNEAKTKGFFVAGLTSDTMVAQVFGLLQTALEKGQSFGSFRAAARVAVEATGWSKRTTNHRLRSVFTNHVLTAYSVGRYKQMQDPDVAASRPFWRYEAVGDSRTRPAHQALDGMVRKNDDPIWDTVYPPNGFACRCTVVTLSGRDVARLGVETTGPTPATGGPDKGWDFNAGKAQWGDALARSAALSDGAKYMGPARAAGLPTLPPATETYEVTDAGGQFDRLLEAMRTRPVVKDPMGLPVLASATAVLHLVGLDGKGGDASRLRHAAAVVPTFERPDEVWLQPYRYQDGRVVLRRGYLERFTERNMAVWAEAQQGAWVEFNTLPMSRESELNKRRRGFLLYERTPRASSGDARAPSAIKHPGASTSGSPNTNQGEGESQA